MRSHLAARWGALAAAALLSACAEVGRPSGGPVDTTPPSLAQANPGSLQVGVDPREPLRLVFSEKIDRRRVARAVTFVPAIPMQKPRFDGTTVEFRPTRDWPADTLVVWTLGPELADKHGVRLGTEVRGAFTTGTQIPDGRIEGRAELALPGPKPPDWKKLRAELDLPAPEGERRRPRWRSAQGDEEGSFALEWLRVPSGPYHLKVYLDNNSNATRDEREPVVQLDSLFVAEADRILVLASSQLRLVDLEGPVEIRLCLDEVASDSTTVMIWVRGEEETRARTATLDTTGCTGLQLPVGRVLYGAWIDDGDRRFGADSTGITEPFVGPDTLVVVPARPDTVTVPWPRTRLRQSAYDSLTVPPVPPEFSHTSPRGS